MESRKEIRHSINGNGLRISWSKLERLVRGWEDQDRAKSPPEFFDAVSECNWMIVIIQIITILIIIIKLRGIAVGSSSKVPR